MLGITMDAPALLPPQPWTDEAAIDPRGPPCYAHQLIKGTKSEVREKAMGTRKKVARLHEGVLPFYIMMNDAPAL